tara:strand:- start:94 stop:714 length:621 start_codon:yes stop_codon:yes gene_type:complete
MGKVFLIAGALALTIMPASSANYLLPRKSKTIANDSLTNINLRFSSLSINKISGYKLNVSYKGNPTIKFASLIGRDLRNAELRYANLTGANLNHANLTGANLTGADLRGSSLIDANLTGADLSDANMTGANLTNANLNDANMSNSYLFGANLKGANLMGANILNANLRGASLIDANLTGISATKLSGCPSSLPRGWICKNKSLIQS